MTISQYANHWAQNIFIKKLVSSATKDTILSHVRKICTLFGKMDLDNLTTSKIETEFEELAQTLQPKTIKSVYGTLRLILQRAQKEGLIISLPNPQLPRIRSAPQPWYTGEEMASVIRNSPEKYKALCHLLSETGMRIGEALALTKNQINWQDLTLNINQSAYRGQVGLPKTDSSYRVICISNYLSNILKNQSNNLSSGLEWIFVNRNTHLIIPHHAAKEITKSISQIGLTWRGWHAFRRGNKTLLRQLGVPVPIRMYRFGHSAKENGIGSIYDQTIGLTSLERQEERRWIEKVAEVLNGKQKS
jgi:integrase